MSEVTLQENPAFPALRLAARVGEIPLRENQGFYGVDRLPVVTSVMNERFALIATTAAKQWLVDTWREQLEAEGLNGEQKRRAA